MTLFRGLAQERASAKRSGVKMSRKQHAFFMRFFENEEVLGKLADVVYSSAGKSAFHRPS